MATIKQKKVANLIIKNKGNVSKSMKEAGYSKASSKNPKIVTTSKGWEELMDEYLPEIELARLHREQLNAEMTRSLNFKVVKLPDNDARLKALDLAYKLKGKYAPEQIELTKRKYQDLSNKELLELQTKLKNYLLKK